MVTIFECIIIFIILMLFIFMFFIVPYLNDKYLFYPQKVSLNKFNEICSHYENNLEQISFETSDNKKLTGFLLNTIRKPKWTDNIFLYSHGNGSWLGQLINYEPIKMLSHFGSVFLYDYRGYGASEGKPSEKGLYKDINGAWKYLTNVKNIHPSKIILYGHSLGCSVSSHLVAKLVKNKKPLPKGLILEAPFSTLNDMAKLIIPSLSSFVIYKFNNLYNVKKINGKIPICLFHSKNDETIPYDHSVIIKKHTQCHMIDITGGHCDPIYNDEVIVFLKNLLSINDLN